MLLLFALALLIATTQCTSLICSSSLYGQPSIPDVASVAQLIPYAKEDPIGEKHYERIFAEPAFFTPSFKALKNTSLNRMMQLPMIWRFKSARLALLTYADTNGKVLRPVLSMDWKTIQSAATTIELRCVDGLRSGGVWIISDVFRTPHAAVYFYEAGSPFETVVTQYMISGKGINPVNPGGKVYVGTELNVTVPAAILGLNATVVSY